MGRFSELFVERTGTPTPTEHAPGQMVGSHAGDGGREASIHRTGGKVSGHKKYVVHHFDEEGSRLHHLDHHTDSAAEAHAVAHKHAHSTDKIPSEAEYNDHDHNPKRHMKHL